MPAKSLPFSRSLYKRWLTAGLLLLVLMVLLGGATRLYHAGLSIIEWELFKGILPPLTAGKWQHYFEAYQQSEEFKQHHYWMNLSDFKTIFWFEYSHRLLGRIIGLWFSIPTAIICWFTSVSVRLKGQLLGINGLIMLQGFFGWYMVKSGLSKNAAVSHYRLALHLSTAFVIITWVVALMPFAKAATISKSRIPLFTLLGIFAATAFYGVLVAGLKAGLLYNTFPLMDGHFFPPDGLFYKPLIINFLKNPGLVQYIHRILAVTCLIMAWFVAAYYKAENIRGCTARVAILLTFQAILGISCLLTHVQFWLALAHQAMALMVLITLVTCLVQTRKS